jgi:hypothetical protein
MKNSVLLKPSGIKSIPLSLASGALRHALRPVATWPDRRLGLPLLLLCAALLAKPCAATPGEWELTGKLNMKRSGGRSVLLLDGRALVVGTWASVELYDPASATWTLTGSLNTARSSNTATLLPDGRVLVAGGVDDGNEFLRSAELYDPATGLWSFTGSLRTAHCLHTATLLPNGKVLVAGGLSGTTDSRSAELYDPATGTWTFTERLHVGRYEHTATLLASGKVLVAGGNHLIASAELYDPATGHWTGTGSLNIGRYEHTATLLANGNVLVAAGIDDDDYRSAELYDPTTGTWTLTGSLTYLRVGHTATLLNDGKVLVAGGYGNTAELYDPATGTWSFTGNLKQGRSNCTANLLNNGEVLVAGGYVGYDLDSAELYDPGIFVATQVSGGGTIDGQGDSATFNFRAKQLGGRSSGSLTFSDPAAGISIMNAKVRTLTFSGNTADLGGKARLGDGTTVTYSVSVTDISSDGSADTFSINLSNGYSAGDTLTSGDIKVQ